MIEPVRFMTYSHDGYGLGHLRRNLRLATGMLTHFPGGSVLAATGSKVAHQFRFPSGVDYLKLPSVVKEADDVYVSDGLQLTGIEVGDLRAGILDVAVRFYRPDVVLVDRYPLGVGGELRPALQRLRESGARIVLGLRDILDEPAAVRREWDRKGHGAAIDEFYDQVFVYGSADVYDPAVEYGWPESVTAKTTMTGYLAGATVAVGPDEIRSELRAGSAPLAVCTSGGGMDGGPLAWAFLDAMRDLVGQGWTGMLVTGPLLPPAERERLELSARTLGVVVKDFVPELASYLDAADVVVAMGGYNTMCDVLDLGLAAVIVPRVTPRREQVIRASRFAELEVLDMVHPDDLTGPSLRAAMVARAGVPRSDVRSRVAASFDLCGLDCAAGCVAELLAAKRNTATIVAR